MLIKRTHHDLKNGLTQTFTEGESLTTLIREGRYYVVGRWESGNQVISSTWLHGLTFARKHFTYACKGKWPLKEMSKIENQNKNPRD